MATWLGTWKGGRIRRGRSNTRRYVLERMVDGKSYAITLDVHSEAEAEAELALFNRDPRAYQTKGEQQKEARAAVLAAEAERADLAPELVKRFKAHLETRETSTHHIANTIGYLVWWDEMLTRDLGLGWDLRKLKLATLKKQLDKVKTAQRKRAMSLKRYTKWLREEAGLLHPTEDPTSALTFAVAPAARTKGRRGYDMSAVEAVYKRIPTQIVRDVIRVHCATGMHNTEIRRLCASTNPQDVREVEGHGEIVAVVTVWHKKKAWHTLSIDRPTLLAIRRLQARGGAPEEKWVTKVLHGAANAAGHPGMNYGQLRHSVTAWLETSGREVLPVAGKGVPLSKIASTLNHSEKTNRKFYRVTGVLPMLVSPIQLRHAEDPADLVSQAGGVSRAT